MSIAETAMREAVANLVRSLLLLTEDAEADATNDNDAYAGFCRGQVSGFQSAMRIIRRDLAEYLPCACGQPSVGSDLTGAQMCSRCADEASFAIPVQSDGTDR